MVVLVYGSYGYTGSLIVDRMVDQGMAPVLGGRDTARLESQAAAHDLDARPFSLDYPDIVADRLADVDVLCNCAGPFADTAGPLVDACLTTGTDYLDITGELAVLESLAARDASATEVGVSVLPAVGFDVVPTDCLARHLADALPGANTLTLGLRALGSVSPGTAATMVEGLGGGPAIRADGRLVRGREALRRREIDVGNGPVSAMTLPWGDLATAYRSTGIPNIEVYFAFPPGTERALSVAATAPRLVGSAAVGWVLRSAIDRFVEGPDAEQRRHGRTHIWGEVRTGDGERREARLHTPEAYRLTAMTAVESVRRTLDGAVPPGFGTPATVFGPDYVLEFDGVRREDATRVLAPGAGGGE